jgi:predicted HicB family RNase H-like nuclease
VREKKSKKVGRPKLSKGEARSVVLQARVQPDERAAYARAAKAQGIDLSTCVREALNNSLERQAGYG